MADGRLTDAVKVERRERVAAICRTLPGVEVSLHQGQHLGCRVCGRTVLWLTDDEHGDGRVGLVVKPPPGSRDGLLASPPERFYFPPYLGPRGWVALRLDLDVVDWDEVQWLIRESYRQVAPKRLAALVPEVAGA